MSEGFKAMRGALDPVERSLEALFGLIMVLTFTGTLSVWTAGRAEVREMLVGALGCNIAWGIIDAAFYLMGTLAARGRGIQLIRRLRTTRDPKETADALEEGLPEKLMEILTPAEHAMLRERVAGGAGPPKHPTITLSDIKGAIGVFLWVFLVTFPVVLPFLFTTELPIALRVSNGIAIVLLYFIGWRLGRYAGFRPWLTGLIMVLLGAALVALTIALGG